MNEKLMQVINGLQLEHPVTEIAEKTGHDRGNVSKYLSGKTKASKPFLKDFCKAFNLDFDKTFPKEVIPIGNHAIRRAAEDAFEGWRGLPMYNVPITASFVEQYRDETTYEPQYYFRDPRFKDCDFGAIVTGDSMHSEIRHGDFVVCKEITDHRFIVFGEIYYIVADNGLETCKYVNAGEERDEIMLVPRNEKISRTPIKKEWIRKLYKVRGIVRGY